MKDISNTTAMTQLVSDIARNFFHLGKLDKNLRASVDDYFRTVMKNFHNGKFHITKEVLEKANNLTEKLYEQFARNKHIPFHIRRIDRHRVHIMIAKWKHDNGKNEDHSEVVHRGSFSHRALLQQPVNNLFQCLCTDLAQMVNLVIQWCRSRLRIWGRRNNLQFLPSFSSITYCSVHWRRKRGAGGLGLPGFSYRIPPICFSTSTRFVKISQLSPTILVLCCAG